jgi:hypothetical protein
MKMLRGLIDSSETTHYQCNKKHDFYIAGQAGFRPARGEGQVLDASHRQNDIREKRLPAPVIGRPAPDGVHSLYRISSRHFLDRRPDQLRRTQL